MSSRPFDEVEVTQISELLISRRRLRDHLLFLIGITCGLRIREILSLTVADVWNGQAVVYDLNVNRARLKGGKSAKRRSIRGRRIPLAENIRQVIAAYLARIGTDDPAKAVFSSRQSHGQPMTQFQAYRCLRAACYACGIDLAGVSTHSMRKTFAQSFYNRTKDLLLTQTALGHANPLTTAAYLRADQEQADRIIRELGSRLSTALVPAA